MFYWVVVLRVLFTCESNRARTVLGLSESGVCVELIDPFVSRTIPIYTSKSASARRYPQLISLLRLHNQVAFAGSCPQFFRLLADRLSGFFFAFSSCAKCRAQYAATFLMCGMSSSSYFSGSLLGFFFRISMILRPLFDQLGIRNRALQGCVNVVCRVGEHACRGQLFHQTDRISADPPR